MSDPTDSERAHLRQVLGTNLARVRALAASSAGSGAGPSVVAVTKAVDPAVCAAWVELGLPDLGENRVSTLLDKAARLEAMGLAPRWHFIGHLQRNKARRALGVCHVLHSVDSERLAATVTRLADELERPLEAFVEVNLTGEDEKHGCAPETVEAIAAALGESDHVTVRGLMAMGPLDTRPGARSTEAVFREARTLADELGARVPHLFTDGRCALSMGMSGDFEQAAAAGSDLIRVGSALHADLPAQDPPQQAPTAPRAEDR